jgi:hypothetical protein
MSTGPGTPVAPRRGVPWRRTSPRGVLVLGMHRSGTSAATRLVNVLGPSLCLPGDMVRGPWNPNGHFESRALMHLDNALLAQMGRTWWYPPPAGEGYDAVAAAITTTRTQARRVFRRVHRGVPWVWKDPRASVLLPFWRAALGPRLAAVVVFRHPLEVAESLERRHGVPLSFGVALWERYNRLILAHSAGLPVLVTSYDELMADPVAWTGLAADFLASLGMDLPGRVDRAAVTAFVDAELRHSTRPRAEVTAAGPGAAAVYDALHDRRGASHRFVAPALAPEAASVTAELDTVGPHATLAWRPPPHSRGPSPTGREGRA